MSLSELKNDLNDREVEDVETILFVYGLGSMKFVKGR